MRERRWRTFSASCHGLGDDAAATLAILSQRMMPDEEFAIVYPGSERGPERQGAVPEVAVRIST
ncbi:MAG: hypothetical protein AAB242_02895 [Nitrospirota bacterium]